MKIITTFGLVVAIVLIGAVVWTVFRPSPNPAPKQVVGAAPVAPGAALVEVELPASLSTEAVIGKTYYDAVCASCHGAAPGCVKSQNLCHLIVSQTCPRSRGMAADLRVESVPIIPWNTQDMSSLQD